MVSHTFIYLLTFVNLISVIHIGLFIIGANTYDIFKFRSNHKDKKLKPSMPQIKYNPLVSVIIPAHNEADVICRTIKSVLISNYQNIEIIVSDDGSTDDTKQNVRKLIKKLRTNEKTKIRTYFTKDGYFKRSKYRYVSVKKDIIPISLYTQQNQGKAAAMNHVIKNRVNGELVMCLDADSILHPEAINKAVNYFNDDKIVGVAANVRIIGGRSILSRLQQFEHLIGYRSKKFFNIANCEFIIGGVASTYRYSTLKKVNFYDNDTLTEDIGLSLKIINCEGNKEKRITYAADVVAVTEGVHSFRDLVNQRYRWKMGNIQNLYKYKRMVGFSRGLSKTLTLYRIPMAVISEVLLMLEPLILAYIIYLCIAYNSFLIIIGAYIMLTFYTLIVVWLDEHLKIIDKIKLSFIAGFIYIVFYIMDMVQIYSIFKSLFKYKNIYKPAASTWVSPKRVKASLTY